MNKFLAVAVLTLTFFMTTNIFATSSIPKESTEPLLPPFIYAVPGVEMNVYFRNIVLFDKFGDLQFKVNCKIGNVKNDRWTLKATSEQTGTFPFSVTVLKNGKKVGVAQSKLMVAPADAGKNKKIKLLIIGDSLTNATHYPNRIADLLSNPGNPQWEMLGTHKLKRAKKGVVHEGYGGWTWYRFVTRYEAKPNPAKRKISSPFVFLDKTGKPKLDFARYLKEKCGGKKPEYITVLLGINDCFLASRNPDKLAGIRYKKMFKNADILIGEFRKACPDAKIGICVTPPANIREGAFVANYKVKYKVPWNRVQFELDKRIIEKFSNREKENIYLIPVELNLDIINGFPHNNAVHPNKTGYEQIGDSIYSWLKVMLTN